MRWAFSTAARMVWWRCIRPDWRCQLLWLPSFRYKVVLFHKWNHYLHLFPHTKVPEQLTSKGEQGAASNSEEMDTSSRFSTSSNESGGDMNGSNGGGKYNLVLEPKQSSDIFFFIKLFAQWQKRAAASSWPTVAIIRHRTATTTTLKL